MVETDGMHLYPRADELYYINGCTQMAAKKNGMYSKLKVCIDVLCTHALMTILLC